MRAKLCCSCRMKLNHPRSGTGRWYATKNGYIVKSRTLQHREIMEQHIGRKLDKNECVHHIDGNRSNNNIENLQLMKVRDHHVFHIKGREKQMSMKGHEVRWGYKYESCL